MGAPFAASAVAIWQNTSVSTIDVYGWRGIGPDCFPEQIHAPAPSRCDTTTLCCWSHKFRRAIGKCTTQTVEAISRDGTFGTLLDMFLSILRNGG